MRLIPLMYYGFTAMDRRFSSPMLPWIISEIRKRGHCEKLSAAVEDGHLQMYNTDFEVQLTHRVANMSRFSQADIDPSTFLYLLRDDNDQLLYCYLYKAYQQSDVTDLYQQMKEQSAIIPVTHNPLTRSLSSAAMLTSLCVDISPSSSNFFEVLYIGKIKVWQKNVPDTFIDDALQKFKVHDLERARKKLGRLKSEMNLRRSIDLVNVASDNSRESSPPVFPKKLTRSHSLLSNLSIKSPDIDRQMPEAVECIAETTDHHETIIEHQSEEENDHEKIANEHDQTNKKNTMEKSCSKDNDTSTDDSTDDNREQSPTANDCDVKKVEYEMKPVDASDHNRTMVLQIDRTDLRLISPDRKVILLNKQHRDVFTCLQGIQQPDHFGFVCRETTNLTTFTGYVFRCQSSSVATETVSAITQAYTNVDYHSSTTISGGTKHNTGRRQSSAVSGGGSGGNGGNCGGPIITSCEHCPMVWYHKLCSEVEHLNDRKTQEAILSRIYLLEEQEKNIILAKFRGAETDSLREQNEFLMMLLRAHCEMKQARHVHDTPENRTEFLNQYLGGNTIFMKAKRSLTNSFDHLLKRRASKDDFGPVLREMNLPLNRESPPSQISYKTDSETESCRSRSSTMGSQETLNCKDTLNIKDNNLVPSVSPDKTAKSPMLDIFMKVGTNPKANTSEDGDNISITSTNGTPPHDHQMPSNSTSNTDSTSWRQNIFKRVITSGKNSSTSPPNIIGGNVGFDSTTKKSREELRVLWNKAIKQAVLLVRMEKENAKIRAQQESSAVKRIKLEYDELKSVYQVVPSAWWEMFLSGENHDRKELIKASRHGIPRGKRGEIWKLLVEEDDLKLTPVDTNKFPNYHVPYDTLLKQLTSHQHAILIDLGRTFPNHSYFSSPLGPGQLALFNLLKAYSLLDPEVGYCQGLSFVAGVLLLHLDECDSFYLLRHLMFRRSLRRQYLPNMVGLQIQLYQLSRLVRDRLPNLHQHLDQHDVDPTLYAAPWLLTIFASQFPLGFVTRVFDLMFLEDPEVLFRAALSLLEYHKEELLNYSSFEEIMDYMKLKLATFEREQLDRVMDQVYAMDISRPLLEYDIEYTVLQEEMLTIQPQVAELHRLQKITSTLTAQNKVLNTQLDLALTNVQRLEMTRTVHQNTINKLEMQNRTLEVSITALSSYIRNLVGDDKEQDLPADIKRIMSQVTYTERRRSGGANFMNLFGKKPIVTADGMNTRASPHRVMVKSLSTGRIIIPDSIRPSDLIKKSLTHEVLDENTEKQSFFSRAHQDILKTNDQTRGLTQNHVNSAKKNRSRCDIVPCEVIEDVSPTDSVDSGVITPDSHPLCGADVTFNYQGTRELKKVKCLRSAARNSSPDLLNPN